MPAAVRGIALTEVSLSRSYAMQPNGRTTPYDACESFIGMTLLVNDELYQLAPDRNREGCRALRRMLAPVPQSDSGTFLQSLGAVPVSKSVPPTGTAKPRRDFLGW
jgi:hypothetical protein